jgi:F420-dependent oxidoreductase-like protein
MTKFGLQIPSFSFGGPDSELFENVSGLAQAAEQTGFDSIWVMDHFYQLPPLGGPDQPMLESYTTLGALGARTSRVKLGALVGGVTYRNPALVAKAATTLDVITGGRAICGLGAAWFDVEHEGLGFDFPPAGERLSRLEEAVQIVRAMFTEDSPSFDGKYYQIKNARNVPRPIQTKGIPIMVGGGGEKRTLRTVARYADMCNLFGDAETLRHKFDVLRQHCEDAGRPYEDITRSRLATMIITDTAEQTESMRQMLASIPASRAAAAYNVGNEKEILSQIEELEAAGVQYFIFNMPTSNNVESVRRAGEMLHSR